MIRLSHKNGILKGTVHLPASKSISNRVLVLQHVLCKKLKIDNLSEANDTQLLRNILNQFDLLNDINAQDAGTAFRFLTAVLAKTPGARILRGEKRMHERPVEELVSALKSLGADIQYLENSGYPPLQIQGRVLRKDIDIDMRHVRSSQFISALMLIAHSEQANWRIHIDPKMNSKSFLHLTVEVLNQLGAETVMKEDCIDFGAYKEKTQNYAVEADWTSFYYFYGMAMLAKETDLFFPQLTLKSIQKESGFHTAIQSSGLELTEEEEGVRLRSTGSINSQDVHLNFQNFPDLWPTFACALTGIRASFRATGLSWLKYKESNRLDATITELGKLGATCMQNGDFLDLDASEVKLVDGVFFNTYEDHRMAMSASMFAVQKTIFIEQPEEVVKSFPTFWEELGKIGFIIEEL